jgi:hypothetical protein
MKKLLLFFSTFLFANMLLAQVPSFFTYQGVIRDAAGQAYANKDISIKVSVIDSVTSSTVQYVETHTVKTTDYGLYNITVGLGNKLQGVFNDITWVGGNKFLKVEFDPLGGSNYVLSGITQILSVPYALVAGKVKGNFLVSKAKYNGVYLDTIKNPRHFSELSVDVNWIDGEPEDIDVNLINNPSGFNFVNPSNGSTISFPYKLNIAQNEVSSVSFLFNRAGIDNLSYGLHYFDLSFTSSVSKATKVRRFYYESNFNNKFFANMVWLAEAKSYFYKNSCFKKNNPTVKFDTTIVSSGGLSFARSTINTEGSLDLQTYTGPRIYLSSNSSILVNSLIMKFDKNSPNVPIETSISETFISGQLLPNSKIVSTYDVNNIWNMEYNFNYPVESSERWTCKVSYTPKP